MTPDRDDEAQDTNGDGRVSGTERVRFHRRLWRAAPRSIRRTVTAVVGATLIVTGALLVVLPGPFTLPLILLGLAVLASEYAWAAKLLEKSRSGAERALRKVRRRQRGGDARN